jgi:hypothetical protein
MEQRQVATPIPPDAAPMVIAPLDAAQTLLARCPEDMVAVAGSADVVAFCVERFESPGEGKPPDVNVSQTTAAEGCASRGRRLCSGDEWERACRGEDLATYPYGPGYIKGKCNVDRDVRGALALVGSHPACVSAAGALDMSGNAAEWTAELYTRGGSAMDLSLGRCSDRRLRTDRAYSDVGYRCCLTPP